MSPPFIHNLKFTVQFCLAVPSLALCMFTFSLPACYHSSLTPPSLAVLLGGICHFNPLSLLLSGMYKYLNFISILLSGLNNQKATNMIRPLNLPANSNIGGMVRMPQGLSILYSIPALSPASPYCPAIVIVIITVINHPWSLVPCGELWRHTVLLYLHHFALFTISHVPDLLPCPYQPDWLTPSYCCVYFSGIQQTSGYNPQQNPGQVIGQQTAMSMGPATGQMQQTNIGQFQTSGMQNMMNSNSKNTSTLLARSYPIETGISAQLTMIVFYK